MQCTLARERTLAVLNNQCPKAGGRQLNHHTWNSCFPGDEFLCWGGRKEQSRFKAFLVHTWARLKSSQGGLLQQRDEWFPLWGTSYRQAGVVRSLVGKPPLIWDNGGLFIFYFLPAVLHEKLWVQERYDGWRQETVFWAPCFYNLQQQGLLNWAAETVWWWRGQRSCFASHPLASLFLRGSCFIDISPGLNHISDK